MYRSEFHINPSDETMHMSRARCACTTVRLKARKKSRSSLKARSLTPAGTPHSPRFPEEAFALISERKRRAGEIDRFQWYCLKCDTLLHEESFVVEDYALDPVSKAYKRLFDSGELSHV